MYCLAVLYFDLPLITIHISDYHQFSDIHILQGSVATYVRCDGIFQYDFVANLPLSCHGKNFENCLRFREVMGKSLVSCFLLTHSVVCATADCLVSMICQCAVLLEDKSHSLHV